MPSSKGKSSTPKNEALSSPIVYHRRMLEMLAKRYVDIAKKKGNKEAMAWANVYIPEDATAGVKSIVEKMLGIVRPNPDDPKAA